MWSATLTVNARNAKIISTKIKKKKKVCYVWCSCRIKRREKDKVRRRDRLHQWEDLRNLSTRTIRTEVRFTGVSGILALLMFLYSLLFQDEGLPAHDHFKLIILIATSRNTHFLPPLPSKITFICSRATSDEVWITQFGYVFVASIDPNQHKSDFNSL